MTKDAYTSKVNLEAHEVSTHRETPHSQKKRHFPIEGKLRGHFPGLWTSVRGSNQDDNVKILDPQTLTPCSRGQGFCSTRG